MGGHHFGQPYTLSPLLIQQTITSPFSLVWYAIAFSFLQPYLSFLYPGQGILMYSYTLLGKSHELQTYRLIFLILAIITSPPCLLHSIIFTFSSQSWFLSLVAIFHILFTWNDDSSHIDAQRVVTPLPSFHHLTLIRNFSLKGCLMGWGFHVFISDLREFIHSLQFLIGL